MHFQPKVWQVAAALAAATCLIGCEQPGQDHGPMQDLTAEQRSQKMAEMIKNNPNMPQAAKDAALGAVQSHAGVGPPKKK